MSCVSETTLKPLAATLPNATLVAPVNPLPVIVTVVPPAVVPDDGEIDVVVGAGGLYVYTSAAAFALVPPAVVTET